ncbi:MAG: hypothetical protein A2V57_02205 [Candidatus Aminicenantes bacterium RBG_19FT_COMBO_65_30]|nr:MAG: hypothetical protein A2V57_02205 [Candidatus Aminicenantes bacterium RBG_19FT_COMBO_65_30]
MTIRRIAKSAALLILVMPVMAAQTQGPASGPGPLDDGLARAFRYRAIGPARQCGRILHVAAHPSEPFTFYISPGTGGLWRTTNNGTTFESLLPEESNVPVGHFAIAPSDPKILWVGTGDPASGRIPIRGSGVMKSVDGGKTWKSMGLAETRHIGRIAIHPSNPDIVFIAALGYHFSANSERGLYKTRDGGRTWAKVLDLGDKVGFVEVVLRPGDPDVVFAASYDKSRVPWNFDDFGPGTAIFKSADGGEIWRKLAGGLPSGNLGRIGLAIAPKNPDIMYATIDNANERPRTEEEAKRAAAAGAPSPRPAQVPRVGGEVYRSEDGGETWKKMNSAKEPVGGGKWYGQIYIDPNDDKVVYVPNTPLYRSLDGGKTWGAKAPENLAGSVHVDHHAIWIDPADSRHIILGHDGGLAVSYDFGKTWDAFDSLPLAQYYAVGVDMDEPYNIYGGLQDNGSVKIPSNGPSGMITRDDWTAVGGGDGMVNVVDPADSRWLYNASQNGAIQRVDQKLGLSQSIRPRPPAGGPAYRFNWTAPIAVSPHNSQIITIGAQVLLRSLNRGDTWQEISPDLTTNDPVKLKGNIEFCTLTSIAESPLEAGLIWVGTDDGKVQVTRNGGGAWRDVTGNLTAAGAPEEYYVTRVFASAHKPGTAYAAKAGWHRDDYRPFVFRTEDFGETWANITADLPEGTVYVIAEDRRNPGLLFAGTEMSVFASVDGGRAWRGFGSGLPPNALVHDLLIHPRANDLVVATHGRGLFVVDISPLQEMNDKFFAEDLALFEIEPKIPWTPRRRKLEGSDGDRKFSAPNEPAGMVINYYLKSALKDKDKAVIRIADPYGEEMAAIEGKGTAGLQSVVWDMRRPPAKKAAGGGEPAQAGRFARPRLVPPGEYVVPLEAAGRKLVRRALVRAEPER